LTNKRGLGYSHSVRTRIEEGRALLKSRRLGRPLQVALILLILTFFGIALYNLLPQILSYNWQFDPTYLGLALFLIVVRGPLGSHGWWAIMRQLGYTLPWLRSLRVVYYSTLAGYLPGGMWHAVSRVYLAEKEGAPRVITLLSVLIESALVALGAALIAPLAILAWPDFPVWLVIGTLAVLVAFMLQPNVLFRTMDWALVRIKRDPTGVKMTPWEMLRLLWPYALNWLLFGIMSFALVAAIYPQIPIRQAPAIAGVFTTAWLVGYVAIFVPQGLIVREVIIVSFLTGVLAIPVPVATASALLSRLWSMLGVAFWGAISTRL
jgi:hypothetical protein